MPRSFFLCDELSYKVSFLKYEVNDFMLILDRLLPLLLLLEHIEERSFSVPSCLFDYEGMKTFQMICQVTSIPTGFIIISTCKTSSKLFIVGLLEIFPHHWDFTGKSGSSASWSKTNRTWNDFSSIFSYICWISSSGSIGGTRTWSACPWGWGIRRSLKDNVAHRFFLFTFQSYINHYHHHYSLLWCYYWYRYLKMYPLCHYHKMYSQVIVILLNNK